MIPFLRLLCLALMLALAGCATQPPAPLRAPAPVQIPEQVWQQVDHEILGEAVAARAQATSFARRQMEHWRQLAADRAETDFIPWFSSYTTQQWLTVKVAWYKLNAGEGDSQAEDRLAAYLQEQYYERVLAPVAREVDPVSLVGQSTKLFIQHLRQGLRPIPSRHGIPEAQFAERLNGIRAIALSPPPAPGASLNDIVATDPIDSLPAYLALLKRIREAGNNDGVGLSKTRISPVARRISEKLLNQLAISGGAGATSTLIGGVVGSVISVGAVALGVLWHEAKRQDIEIALRETLNAAQDDMWKILMDDPDSAVSAGIYHIFEQIEGSLPQTVTHAMTLDAPPQAIPLPEPPVPDRQAMPDDN
ncbi:hypothetical protein LZ012_00655 [Dechloromonas sp. XY25]|uniref:Lipoprotein n=1 Tax=Dechloromonas hankyongensis TaxID=2908002 RepID=A0ABS9JX72_9RHOO|nr:hypothetical protein [Dechloromonas hankyongensis]MCG2575498.1 hypothetical protein [Dechloromonas hankyongensis]